MARFNEDLYVTGAITGGVVQPTAATVGNAEVEDAAGVEAQKLIHQQVVIYTQAYGVDAAADRRTVYIARSIGVLKSAKCGATGLAGASSSCVFNVLRNGSTVLTGTVTLDNGTAAFALKDLPISGTELTYAANDVFEVAVTSPTGANPPEGIFALLVIQEAGLA